MPTAEHIGSMRPRILAAGALAVAVGGPALAAEPLAPEELTVIEQRLAPIAPAGAKLSLGVGETLLVEGRVTVESRRLKGPSSGYEGVMAAVGAPPGLVIRRRAEELRMVRRGGVTEVVFAYAVGAEASAKSGGTVRARFELRERAGLGNTLATKEVRHVVVVVAPDPSRRDLSADFLGYRDLRAKVQARASALEAAGVRGLSLDAEGAPRGTERLNAAGAEQLDAFYQERRRMWTARAHLAGAARAARDPALREMAAQLLAALDVPDPGPLPLVALLDAAPPPPPEPIAPVRETPSGRSDTLAPVAEYEVGSEGTVRATPPPVTVPPPEPEPRKALEPAPKPQPRYVDGDPALDPELLRYSAGLEEVPADPGDADRLIRRYYLPNYPRSLVLDDTNIAHGFSVRASYAEVERPEPASTAAVFYAGQVGLTPDFGLELTVPTQLVSLSVGGLDQSLYNVGNPLLAAKYRFHLPNVGGRKPALTIRGRWGMALFQQHQIPASDLITEDFVLTPNLGDTYAFMAEQTDLGLGASLAWQRDWLLVGAQVYVDYFLPTEIAANQNDLLTLSYAASVGVLPFGDIVGAFLEVRALSFLAGAQRTEAFAYAGFRAHLFEVFEPAIWAAVPVGSVAETSSAQVGLELALRYDVRSIVQLGNRLNGDRP